MSGRKRILVAIALLGVGILSFLVGVAVQAYPLLHASLPALTGVQSLPGLGARVLILRDAHGIPIIEAHSRLDAARATGFVHAQDRFFQMDLLRRSAAGELSELFGARALDFDLQLRKHLFRARAAARLRLAPAQERLMLDAYAAGVNAGLRAMAAPPFEYFLLRNEPAPWRAEDVYLVVYTMYLRLQDDTGIREAMYGSMRDTLPPALYAFLSPAGTKWDAALDDSLPPPPAPIPGPQVADLRTIPHEGPIPLPHTDPDSPVAGSNAFAVVGSRTALGGAAMLANDMHLQLSVPDIWFHLALRYPDATGHERRVCGVSLPGTPAIVAGSNGHIAWGFTNSMVDVSDLIELHSPPDHPEQYYAPGGPENFQHVRETIRVHGASPVPADILNTRWGPVMTDDHAGHARALRWLAHDPDAVGLSLLQMEQVKSVAQALAFAPTMRIPTQNFVVADADGHIGWTLAGAIPLRTGLNGRSPQSWAEGGRGWTGTLSPEHYPRIMDPAAGFLWSANARPLGEPWLTVLGDGGYTLAARARQIREDLKKLDRVRESDLLAIQLDDRAEFFLHWKDLLLETLSDRTIPADWASAMRRSLSQWNGRASIDSSAYRLVRAFRKAVDNAVFSALTEQALKRDPDFDYHYNLQREQPLWELVTQRPMNLLSPAYASWNNLLSDAAKRAFRECRENSWTLRLADWGDYNRIQIRHPLSRALPVLGHFLDMPEVQLPGDVNMPRVQTRTHGASMRMVVSPGKEESGILEIPAGQSGHPLSPYYGDEQRAWESGEAVPFLPGEERYRLVLAPAG